MNWARRIAAQPQCTCNFNLYDLVHNPFFVPELLWQNFCKSLFIGSIGSAIGSYKNQPHSRNYAEVLADWTTHDADFKSNPEKFTTGKYDENSEYSLYRWTYFFDYEETDYNPGPEKLPEIDQRFKDEETRLANAILWLHDYDNSQQRRRSLLENTYLINRFSYPDANQDGQKFTQGETHSKLKKVLVNFRPLKF